MQTLFIARQHKGQSQFSHVALLLCLSFKLITSNSFLSFFVFCRCETCVSQKNFPNEIISRRYVCLKCLKFSTKLSLQQVQYPCMVFGRINIKFTSHGLRYLQQKRIRAVKLVDICIFLREEFPHKRAFISNDVYFLVFKVRPSQ